MDLVATSPLAVLWPEISSGQSLGVLLWIGLGALTISLLILMRTRWGQAKPISKCVALSVFAHVLLFGYAYATRLILDVPAPDEVIEFTFVPPTQNEESEYQSNPDPAPWERLANTPSLDSGVPLPQPKLAIQQAPAPFDDAPPQAADVLDAPALQVVQTTPAIKRPKADSPTAPEPARETSPAPINLAPVGPPANTQVADAVLAPPAIGPERVNETASTAPENDTIQSAPHPNPASMLNIASQLQHLLDNPLESESADAIHDPLDRLRANQPGRAMPGRLASSESTPGGGGAPVKTADSTSSSPAPRRIGDGEPVPIMYQSRIGGARWEQVLKHGGSKETEQAVERALQWLAKHQAQSGAWIARDFGGGQGDNRDGQQRDSAGAEADTGITGLALLAFLAHGNTHLEGPYRTSVRRGLEYLLDRQAASGDLSGRARLYAKMYCHGMASLAISEAWAMTGDRALRPAVERAVAFTVAAQHPTTGGWRYQPGDEGDTSQFGWQLLALKSAEYAGVRTPDSTRSGMVRFLRLVSTGRNLGLASYRPRGAPSRTMTAEALLCRLMLDEVRRPSAVREATDFILEEPPRSGQMNLYYWYYGSLALFQIQGKPWERWNEALQRQILPKQRLAGDQRGSWDPDTTWGGYGGRVYSTAMGALCLEVYYRYLPVLN